MQKDLFERHRSLQWLVGLAIVALAINVMAALWSVLVVVGDVILLFLLSWIIAFILEPVSVLLQRRGLPRLWAVSLIYVALIVVVSGAVVLAVPALESEVRYLANEVTSALSPSNLPALSRTATGLLERFGLSPRDAQNLVNQAAQEIPARARDLANASVALATSLVTQILTIIFDATLIAIISFYIMLDGGRLVEALVRRLPPSWIPDVRLFQRYVQDIFAGYFRAQLIIGGIYAVFTWLVLLVLGQPNGVLAAVLSGLIMLIPFVGAFLAIVPPALVMLLQTPSDQIFIKLAILIFLLGAAQHVVLNLIAPRIFGQHMGVPTLVLFAALLMGAKQGGVWGAFFAGPVVAVGYAMFEVFYERFQFASDLFPHHVKEEPERRSEGPPEGEAGGTREARPTPPLAPTSSGDGGTAGGTRDKRPPYQPEPREPVSRGSGPPRPE
jgi:predicted PurR-regulated permease PerM